MKRNTKSALLLSVVSIVVCCAMLMGTTMAWFTDSVTSARNQIIAGNIDVELYRDTIAAANKIDGNTKLFDEVKLWEPGAVLVENLVVSNEGNLALKYKLALSHFNATETPDGKTLTDVIKVGFVEGGVTKTERADVLAEVASNWTSFNLFNLEGKLDPKGKDLTSDVEDTRTVGIVLYWEPTDNDNDYNMNNGENTVLDITFGINLFATQLDAEEDSFGKDYDVIDDLDMITENINGVTYGTIITGDYVMVSVDDYTLTNFAVDNAVTILGTGNGVDDNDRVFGKNAPLTSLTLPEGLVEIKDNALNALPNLTTVNLPSTLKTIGIQAFRTTGMSELKVPESVETVKLGAFRDMANLTTVTVEGNVAFDKYAFRSCPNLTSIYLLGDDVTFTGGQFATHSDNGDATGITIYVKNTTVAARVYAAQASAYGYEVKILGNAADGSDASDVEKVANNTSVQ